MMGEAEEGEGFRTPLVTLLSGHCREPAERDQPRLVLVQRQAKPNFNSTRENVTLVQ
jgi:hypothetical protein